MSRIGFVFITALAALTIAACKKDPPPPPVDDVPAVGHHPDAAPPVAGTDADNKRIEALDLAVKTDAALATFAHSEKTLGGRKVEAWTTRATPPQPKKIVIATVDDKGVTTGTLDLYYDDKGLMTFARASDGLFVFQMESLALWLDADQKVKRGVKPAEVGPRVSSISTDNKAALALFGLR